MTRIAIGRKLVAVVLAVVVAAVMLLAAVRSPLTEVSESLASSNTTVAEEGTIEAGPSWSFLRAVRGPSWS